MSSMLVVDCEDLCSRIRVCWLHPGKVLQVNDCPGYVAVARRKKHKDGFRTRNPHLYSSGIFQQAMFDDTR